VAGHGDAADARAGVLSGGGWHVKQGKVCFFVKKQQKTFDSDWPLPVKTPMPQIKESFLLLFYKKADLIFPRLTTSPHQ
jgi:hypothetical protein